MLLSLLAVALAASILLPAAPAWSRARKERSGSYAPPFSAMVLDPVSQRVLYELDADGPRHPASLTKVMTLYILFEELEKGGLRLDSPLTASWKAINQAPSRLGLQKGETIAVEDAIKAVVTRSANDVAMVIAENLGGSEQDFVERMNATALRLGMHNTTFANPTGLPDKRQITTARDLVLLGKGIRERFPDLFGYFSIRSFDYAGKTVFSHNKLMNRLQGMEGIKTGFINASGFNLLASVRRERQSVVAVVLGGTTARARDTRMAELVEATLPKATPLDPPGLAYGPGETHAQPAWQGAPAELADMGFHRAGLEGSDPQLFLSTGSIAPPSAALDTPADAGPNEILHDDIRQDEGLQDEGRHGGSFVRILVFLLLTAIPPAAIFTWRKLHVLVVIRVVAEHVLERSREWLDRMAWRKARASGDHPAEPDLARLPARPSLPALAPPRPADDAALIATSGSGFRWRDTVET